MSCFYLERSYYAPELNLKFAFVLLEIGFKKLLNNKVSLYMTPKFCPKVKIKVIIKCSILCSRTSIRFILRSPYFSCNLYILKQFK